MGNSSSKTQPPESSLNWKAAIWRRLKIWGGLEPYLDRVMKAVGLGKYDEIYR